MRKRLVSVLIGIAVLGVVAVALAGGRPDTVPIERPMGSDAAGCCRGGSVEGCTGECACDGSDSAGCHETDHCDRDTLDSRGTEHPRLRGCGGCR